MGLQINKIDEINFGKNLDLYKVHKIMVSNEISNAQKINFLEHNHLAISHLVSQKISSKEFRRIMKKRPLIIYNPLKNSYTKVGDKKLLAMVLEIPQKNVDNYVKEVSLHIQSGDELKSIGLSKDKYDGIKFYIFRHGTKEQVLAYLDYELSHAKNVLKMLYHIFQYKSDGVADYYIRPIHRLDNQTIIKMYDIIYKNLNANRKAGKINEAESQEAAEWALTRIYQLQNNQKIKNAIKLKQELESYL